MRIVHVSDGYPPRLGGIEGHVHDLAARQAAAGHVVSVVTTVAGRDAATVDVEVVQPASRDAARGSRLLHAWAPSGARHPLIASADALHVHCSSVSPLAFLALAESRRRRIPTLVTMHSVLAAAAPLFRLADASLRWQSPALVWSAVSEAAARPLRSALGPHRPVTVLGNAVDAAAWRLPVRPVDSDRLVVATVGRLAARKRPHPLLRILRRTRAQLPDRIRLEAVLIGDGPQRPRLDRYVQRHRMGAWVTFTGIATREEIRRAYRDVDLYIAPATLESFGIAALEARCAGLPVLARAQCGIADFIVDGVDGVLANDDDGLVDGLVRLAQDPVLRSAMRQHNSEVTPAFDWPEVMGRTEALYAQAIAAAGRPDVPSAVAR